MRSRISTCSSVLVSAFLVLAGCGTTLTLQVKQVPSKASERNTTLLAGVGKADITPRPGLPLAGHSVNANYSKGFRTRIYSRVLYLKPVDDKPVALVQCDLLAGSDMVQRRLAEMVAGKTDLDLGGIMMSATHTHAGPGNLAGSEFYNINTSNKGGLDMKFYDFITGQIAGAIIEAYNGRRPAKIATGSMDIFGFTRNRSIEAYRANNNADPEKAKDIRKAVNPSMTMVRVDVRDDATGAFRPAAAFTGYSIHGTSVEQQGDLYSGDVFAYIERELEWEMAKRGARSFVHAAVNVTHADNSPDFKMQCHAESRRLGVGIGRRSIELFDSLGDSLKSDVKIQSAIREIDYFRERSIDGISICDTPRVGNTLLAGAHDGGATPILSWLPFFREGSRRWFFTGGCHGHRRIIGGPLQGIFCPRDEFPHIITYQAVRIGDTLFLPLPYEITMESGRRIAEAGEKAARDGGLQGLSRTVVLSVSNGYTGYCTTPEEYSVQRYEGGHTIYGPNTMPFLAAQSARLVSDMAKKGAVRDVAGERSFRLSGREFYRDYDAPKGPRASLADPSVREAKGREERCWSFRWADVPPSQIEFHRPLVSIETSADGSSWSPLQQNGIPINDQGYDMAVVFTGDITHDAMGVYETRWYNPETGTGNRYRFRIEPRGDKGVFYSKEFK
ncbi:MAG TPA: neutral/alkaline non-lysosomal ceramidase N-terminal domain-containing protein [Spirochaetota bacterium]|nr:neutral/alkaline non-lysosomal ceramidase N-terminal domain-containing protein [Spirochaetota bacterium]